jgi:hypothetical protein
MVNPVLFQPKIRSVRQGRVVLVGLALSGCDVDCEFITSETTTVLVVVPFQEGSVRTECVEEPLGDGGFTEPSAAATLSVARISDHTITLTVSNGDAEETVSSEWSSFVAPSNESPLEFVHVVLYQDDRDRSCALRPLNLRYEDGTAVSPPGPGTALRFEPCGSFQ